MQASQFQVNFGTARIDNHPPTGLSLVCTANAVLQSGNSAVCSGAIIDADVFGASSMWVRVAQPLRLFITLLQAQTTKLDPPFLDQQLLDAIAGRLRNQEVSLWLVSLLRR